MTTATNATPDLSVIVPVHDVAPWVEDCLTSILSDQHVDHEVIVIDDASADGTWEIVEAVAERDPRVRAVRNPGTGGAQARNHGVELARGAYIAFADGDDLVPRNSYGAMLTAAHEDHADMVVAGFLKFYTTRTWHPTASWPAWDERRHATTLAEQPSLVRNRACWNRLFRKDFWTGQKIQFPTVPRSNDIVPMTQALAAARSISVLPDTVYLYRNRPGGSSMSARAAGTTGFASYLRQELASGDVVGAVGDERLDREYERLVLVRDGWVHLQNFLKGLTTSDVDGPLGEDLPELTELIDRLLGRFPAEALDRLEALSRWAWSLARAGRWNDAVRLVNAPETVLISDDAPTFPTGPGGAEKLADDTDRRRALTSVLLRLATADATDPATAELLAAHAGMIRTVYPEGIWHWQPAAVQELLLAARTGDATTVGAVLATPALAVTDARLTVRGRAAELSATIRAAEPVTAVEAGFARGRSWYACHAVEVDPHTGALTASVPVPALPVGPAFLRLRFELPLGRVDVVVSPEVGNDAGSARVFRAGTNRQVHVSPGLLPQMRAAPRRAARRIRSTVRAMRGR
ncbi:hypothetical protein GCM10028784_03450 [Myceligenerans cantabricum]